MKYVWFAIFVVLLLVPIACATIPKSGALSVEFELQNDTEQEKQNDE